MQPRRAEHAVRRSVRDVGRLRRSRGQADEACDGRTRSRKGRGVTVVPPFPAVPAQEFRRLSISRLHLVRRDLGRVLARLSWEKRTSPPSRDEPWSQDDFADGDASRPSSRPRARPVGVDQHGAHEGKRTPKEPALIETVTERRVAPLASRHIIQMEPPASLYPSGVTARLYLARDYTS
jgi:hypothetical protein